VSELGRVEMKGKERREILVEDFKCNTSFKTMITKVLKNV
jgi:hypothetical protein